MVRENYISASEFGRRTHTCTHMRTLVWVKCVWMHARRDTGERGLTWTRRRGVEVSSRTFFCAISAAGLWGRHGWVTEKKTATCFVAQRNKNFDRRNPCGTCVLIGGEGMGEGYLVARGKVRYFVSRRLWTDWCWYCGTNAKKILCRRRGQCKV